MKILVFSDSHGAGHYIRSAIQSHHGQADALVFLGDGATEAHAVFREFPHIPSYILRGNCDSALRLSAEEIDASEEELLHLGGLRFLALHGHTVHVKSGYGWAVLSAAQKQADAVLFGHTHIPENRTVENPARPESRILLFNPGSIGMSREHSYGVIHIVDGKISAGHGHAVI